MLDDPNFAGDVLTLWMGARDGLLRVDLNSQGHTQVPTWESRILPTTTMPSPLCGLHKRPSPMCVFFIF
jgi:hypothetical protein